MSQTILLIAPATTAEPVAAALRRSLDAEVEIAPNRRTAIATLRRRDFALVLLEESLSAADPEGADLISQVVGTAPLMEINFVLSNAERIVRQVGATLTRCAQDRAKAHTAATASLHSELNATLTGLLLESELALREALPQQEPKLRILVALASDLRELLRA